MFPARVAFAKAEEDAQAKDGEDCFKFSATLQVFEKATGANPASVPLKEITTQTVHVLNGTMNEVHNGQQLLVAETIDERWVVIPGGRPRVQFKTDIHISNRIVTAKVLRVINFAPNLIGGELSPGDAITLHDPFNLRADIEAGATGWAYLADSQVDDQATATINEGHQARYEIEDCSLPTNEIKGYLQTCMHPTDKTGVTVVIKKSDLEGADPGFLRSAYPSVDLPGELSYFETPIEHYTVSASNPYFLSGVAESEVVIRRVTNRDHSDPENYQTPKSKSHTAEAWEIVHTAKPFASFIKVRGQGSQWNQEGVYDGYWPGESVSPPFINCDPPTITCDLCECIDEETLGYAHYDGLTGNYKVTSTQSAFFGNGETTNIDEILGFSGCNLNFNERSAKVFCLGDPTLRAVSLPTMPITAVTGVSLTLGQDTCDTCTYEFVIRESTGMSYTDDGAGNWVLDPADQDESKVCNDTFFGINPVKYHKEPAGPAPLGGTANGTCVLGYWKEKNRCDKSPCECPTSGLPQVTEAQIEDGTYSGGEISSAFQCTGTVDSEDHGDLCLSYGVAQYLVVGCDSAYSVENKPGGCIPITEECPPESTP